jgi:hypothetical protein
MVSNQQHSTEPERSQISVAFKRVVRGKSFLPVLVAMVTILIVAGLPLVNFLSNVIGLDKAGYGWVIPAVLLGLPILMLLAAYFVRFWDEVSSGKAVLLQENKQLRGELAQMQDHLTTALARTTDLVALQAALQGSLLYQFRMYLNAIVSEVERAEHFKEKMGSAANDVTSTRAQLQGDVLTISLPIGRKHGAILSLVYFLSRPLDNPRLVGVSPI